MFRHRCSRLCERYHEYVHLLFGVFFYCIFLDLSHLQFTYSSLVAVIIGSFLPDIDHLFNIFIYGRHGTYSQLIHQFLHQHQYHQVIEYCRLHHKENLFVVSHNILSPVFSLFLFVIFVTTSHFTLAVLFLAILSHFIFDILEDLVILGHFNPNWYFRFSRN